MRISTSRRDLAFHVRRAFQSRIDSLIAIILLVLPCGLLAQSHLLPSSLWAAGTLDTTHAITDSARLATITTDTGAFAPGHRDFSRYDTPGLCLAAAKWTRHVLHRTLEAHDSLFLLRETPERDILGSGGTAAIAQTCATHLQGTDTTTDRGRL